MVEEKPVENSRTKRQKKGEPTTIAELVMDLVNPEYRRALEQHRIEFEALNGPTDLTRHYTSMFPVEVRNWMIANHPKEYFDGLPPFGQSYLRGQFRVRAREGNLDDTPSSLLSLFLSGQMSVRNLSR